MPATGERGLGVAARRLVFLKVESTRLAAGAFALLLAVAAVLMYRMTRGTTLWFDEWIWVVGRRGNDIGTFLHPYNEHLSLVPILIYRALFATTGISDYAPFRLLAIAGHIGCVLLVYVYARRRVGDYYALLASTLILFLGPGWQNILWPFQIAWTIAIATGIGALLLLDRRDRVGDVGACALLAVSLASTSIGVAIAVGALADIALDRRRRRQLWIAGIPLLLYVIWSIAYQHATLIGRLVFGIESYVLKAAAASLSSVLGLSGLSVTEKTGTVLVFGVPLLVVAIAGLLLETRRRGWTPRLLALATVLLVFWVLTALGRALGPPFESRYLYVDGIFVVLLAAELARGARWTPRVGVAVAVVTVAAVVSNIGALRDGAAYLRLQGAATRADLAALDLTRGTIAPGHVAVQLPGYPFVSVDAAQYFATERSIGSPADDPQQLASAPDAARQVADAELIGIEIAPLGTTAGGTAAGTAPTIDSVAGAATTTTGSCLNLVTPAATAPGALGRLVVTVPPAGVRISGSLAAISVALRRFGSGFQPVGTIRAGGSAAVRPASDPAPTAWHLEIETAGRASVCALVG